MLLSAALLAGSLSAQKLVKGQVTDSQGMPVAGASIVIPGTSFKTQTDANGNFSLRNVPTSAKNVVISYLGMSTQTVSISDNMNITLQDDQNIDEVIVVAFGKQKKSSFTGSAAVMSSEDLSKHVTTNVANALIGSTPGLQLRGGSGAPGASQGSIKIRGIASLYAGTDPLIIVDGAPYSASLSNIPPEDIENVTVLKDAASAALYGARGAAGVILVTTKTGKNKEAKINLDMKWGINSRSIQDYETINDPGKYYETIYGQYYNYYYFGQGLTAAAANASANEKMLADLAYNIYTVPNGEYLIGLDGKLNPNAKLGRSYLGSNGETYYLTNDNWRDAAYKNALRQEYTISASGAMDKGSFYASLGYLDEDGIIEYSRYKRLTGRVKADYQAKKWLKLGANIGFTNSNTTSNPNLTAGGTGSTNLFYYASRMGPIYPIFVRVLDENGNPVIRTDENGNPQYDFGVAATNYPGITRPFLATGNPLGANRYNDVRDEGFKFTGTFTADIFFTDYLKFNATSTVDRGQTNSSYYGNALYGPNVSINGLLEKAQSGTLRQNHVQTLTYFDKFGLHGIDFMIGHEYYKTKTTYLWAKAQGLFTPEIKEIAAAAKTTDGDSYTSAYNVEGYFANAQYNYNDKYYASASFRRDATSRFAKEKRWGSFWSVGGAWIMNKEDWFNASWVDQLKLKLSIGQQGNDGVGNWNFIDLYTLTVASDTRMSASFAQIGNPDITWETTTNFNIGAEFGLFNNRLSGGIDFYSKKTKDLLFWLSVPESFGSRGYYGNVGDIRNTGVELSLLGTLIRNKNVEWNVNFNLSHNIDKILKLPESKTADLGGFTEDGYWYKEGGSIYNRFIVNYAGVNEKGEATYWVDDELGKGVNNRPATNRSSVTTNPNEASKYETGRLLPKVYGGFGTSFAAYGFDVSLTFDYQIGGKIYDNMYAGLMQNFTAAGDAGSAVHVDVLKSWTPNNISSTIPRYQFMDQYTVATCDRFLTKASYLNFQSFTVGYTLPNHFLGRYGISKVRVYAIGENLAFWSARKGLDPRYSFSSTAITSAYSPVRTVMGGIQITF